MSKRAVVINAIRRVRSSYWFLPTVLAAFAVLASEATLFVDRNPDSLLNIWPDAWRTTQVDGARATLSVISQSMLGVVGVMFSVTIVAVSFASGNFGPRLVGNFMRDRGTQWSLGILISTFVYGLLILRAVHSADTGETAQFELFVPHLSVGVALLLTGISIIAVIYYVHHIPETINVSNISADLGARLRDAIKRVIDTRNGVAEAKSVLWPETEPDRVLTLASNGYVQNRDDTLMTQIAEEHALFVAITLDVGDFVNAHTPVLEIWCQTELSDEICDSLCSCFVVGSTPTEDQNLLFIVQQLVEMIARALSPGVNDPYTAINCLNWIYAGLSVAANHEGGLRTVSTTRVKHRQLTFDTIFEAGIVQSHSYVKSDPLSQAHLVATLARLETECEGTRFSQTVRKFRKTLG